jgi:hypothetical protein
MITTGVFPIVLDAVPADFGFPPLAIAGEIYHVDDATLEQLEGGVAELVGIESGVVSGLSNPNDSGVGTPVETTPWEAITRSLSPYIRKLRRAPNFFTTGSIRLKRASAPRCGALSRA